MPIEAAAKPEHAAGGRDWRVAVVPAAALAWLAMILILAVRDQLALMPPRPPTPAEAAQARPAAEAHWRLVYLEIQESQEPWQPRRPELGAVWSTRTGDICGLVDRWRTGLDYMTRFYTLGDQLHFRDDDLRLYVRSWSKCMMDPWVVLHSGSDDEGLCASAAGRRNWAALCTTRRSLLPF
jgi:hypothetical protein